MSVKCAGCGMFVEAHDTHIHEAVSVDSMSIESLASMLHVPADINSVRAALARISETSNAPGVLAPADQPTSEDVAALVASNNRDITDQGTLPARPKPVAKPTASRSRRARKPKAS